MDACIKKQQKLEGLNTGKFLPNTTEYFLITKETQQEEKFRGNLSPKDFENIILKNCFYCGCPPRNRMFGGREVCGNGIDRVNNDKDYDLSNVVPCCSSCNIAKYCRTVEDFVLWAEKVAKRKEEILCQICS